MVAHQKEGFVLTVGRRSIGRLSPLRLARIQRCPGCEEKVSEGNKGHRCCMKCGSEIEMKEEIHEDNFRG